MNLLLQLSYCILCIVNIVKCKTEKTKFEMCGAYENKISSSKFIVSLNSRNELTCATECSLTDYCDSYVFRSDDLTCFLYHKREMEYINENANSARMFIRVLENICPDNWHYNAVTNSCYFVSVFRTTFQGALTYCWEKMGAYLTNINDQNEQNFLTNLLNVTSNNDTWIGIEKKTGSTQFQWVSNFNVGPQNLSFVQWAPKEPFENKGAVFLWALQKFKWNDILDYNRLYYFICKKPAVITC